MQDYSKTVTAGKVLMVGDAEVRVASKSRRAKGGTETRLLTVTAGSLNRSVDIALRPEGITADQWRVLGCLDAEGPCTMSRLGGATSISGPTLKRVVDRLVSLALVYRTAVPDDGRQVLVHQSKRGSAVTQRLRSSVADVEDRVFAPLSVDERHELTRLLWRVLAADSSNDPQR